MSFQPAIPVSGIAGLNFIERTRASQQEVFNNSPIMNREIEHFRENVSKATTAEELVKDQVTFKVALGAFGLEEEIGKKFFLQKILEEGTEDQDALANRLVDPRYKAFSEAFGYGNVFGPSVGQSDFASRMIQEYQTRQFEVAVGATNEAIRLALNFKREVGVYFQNGKSEDAGWFEAMGNQPVRAVLEKGLGLPTAVGSLDIDRQLELFKEKTSAFFGDSSLDAFSDPENVEHLLRVFLARDQIDNGPTSSTPGMAALTLLNNSGLGSSSLGNLLISGA